MGESSLASTSLVTVLTSAHGRQRRAERSINIRDLQAAVKYGRKEPALPHPKTGEVRWKYIWCDVVYITDESGRHEITSWAAPGAGFDMPLISITEDMHRTHDSAKLQILSRPQSWTSHTVIVVDQSGSMRKPDVSDGATRSDAVWVTLALTFVHDRILSGNASATDVVSIVQMNDSASLLVDREPVDWHLFNRLVTLLRSAEPKQGGNYQSALSLAEQCLLRNTAGSCALMLLFLSDGKPSDRAPYGPGSVISKVAAVLGARVAELASRFGRRLTVGTIGFGPSGENFSVLSSMAAQCAPFNCSGSFHSPELTEQALQAAVSSLSSTLTATKTELTELGGSAQRTVRDVRRESQHASGTVEVRRDDSWYFYDTCQVISRIQWSASQKEWVQPGLFVAPGACAVAMKSKIFGEGAERMVRQFRELGPDRLTFVGPRLVAKESRFIEDYKSADHRNFHKLFCDTQQRAQGLAMEFNARLTNIPGVNFRTPRISFLECSVYVVRDANLGEVGVLVEKMLSPEDPARYKKWNNNCGFVDGAKVAAPIEPGLNGAGMSRPLQELVIAEGDEEEEDDVDSAGDDLPPAQTVHFTAADIPQAFSHFTHYFTGRKMLVCDLQGVLDETCSPPLFELTDPVIHYWSKSGRVNVYGRTDRGKKGMNAFMKTHKCSELCEALRKTWLSAAKRPVPKDSTSEDLLAQMLYGRLKL